MKQYLLDANLILRFLLKDHPKLHQEAVKEFKNAASGQSTLTIDHLTIAEVIWVMQSSRYQIPKNKIVKQLEKLLSQTWVTNPQKSQLLSALNYFQQYALSFVDCWLLTTAIDQNVTLKTQDKKLQKIYQTLAS